MTLDVSKNLYAELTEIIGNFVITVDTMQLKSILCEYVSLKCSEEIKKSIEEKVYRYLIHQRILAKNIIETDSHRMPRDFKGLEKSFAGAEFDLDGLEDIKLITLIRNKGAHNVTNNIPYTWEQLNDMITHSAEFLDKFEEYISKL